MSNYHHRAAGAYQPEAETNWGEVEANLWDAEFPSAHVAPAKVEKQPELVVQPEQQQLQAADEAEQARRAVREAFELRG